MENKNTSWLPNISGLASPEKAAEFSEKKRTTLTIECISSDTARALYNGLMIGAIGGPVKLAAKTAGKVMDLLSIPFGAPWAVLQTGRKAIETGGQQIDKLKWKDNK